MPLGLQNNRQTNMAGEQAAARAWPRAGASMAVLKGEQVLLIQRDKGALAGLWSLPGGHIEPGERAAEAAVREVQEETSVQAQSRGLLDLHEVVHRDAAGALAAHYLIAVFAGAWLAGEPHAASDARAARFVSLAEAAALPLTEGALGFIERARAARGC